MRTFQEQLEKAEELLGYMQHQCVRVPTQQVRDYFNERKRTELIAESRREEWPDSLNYTIIYRD